MELENGYYSSPRWTWEILDCAMPMTFDTYSNCAHQCSYCFAYFQRAVGLSADAYLHHKVRSVDVDRVKRMFTDPDQYAGQFAWYIKRRMVLQWGGLSDGFDWYEKKFKKSLELLRFWVEMDYPISISTKGTWWVYEPEYREVLKEARNVQVKYSIITTNPRHAKLLEMGTPTPAERFRALAELKQLGVGVTTVRYRPFIIGVSDLCMEEMFRAASDAGCYSITTEWLCLESRASKTAAERYELISRVCRETLGPDYDVFRFYRENSYSGSGLLRLNYDIKREAIERMQGLGEQYGLKFFVSDAHHKEASHSAGCCGLPDTGPLSNINRGQFGHAIKIAQEKGKVQWSDIALLAQDLKNIPFFAAEGHNSDTDERARRRYQSMFDYMRDIWNTPKSWQSPARYFGGALVPAGTDEEGDIVYLYNRPYIQDSIRVSSVAQLAEKLQLTGAAKAARYDQATADGSDWGHVAFPIYVTSKGRATRARTMALLDASRLNYTLVVEPFEESLYRDAFPTADLLLTAGNHLGLQTTRQQVLTHARERGYAGYWLLDDDVEKIVRFEEDGTQQASTARAAMSATERLILDYSNVALAALDYVQFAWSSARKKPFSVNTRAWVFAWVNAQTGLDYDLRFRCKSDVDFLIRHLRTGRWCSLLHHRWAMATPSMATNPGGQSPAYLAGEHSTATQLLKQLYPNLVQIRDKGDVKGLDVDVRWKQFAQPLQPVALEMLLAEGDVTA